MRILSGVQPSGRQHLGNYYGAIAQFVELERMGECYFFIANLHSLTTIQNAAQLREFTLDAALTYLSFGLDPSRSVLFRQSDVPEHSELFWILGSLVPLSHLEKAHSYKDKRDKGIRPDFGLLAYPVLMAADILLYAADLVPVGKDQKQHVEFARDWAIRFNQAYVAKYDPADPNGEKNRRPGILRVPEVRIQAETATIVGTDGQKMSKSYGNTLDLFAPDSAIKKTIMSIKTDSSGVADPKPPEGPLYSLLKTLASESEFKVIEESWLRGGSGYGVYKQNLLDLFHAHFDGARARRTELEKDVGYVESVLKAGAEKARLVASEQLRRVKEATGLL